MLKLKNAKLQKLDEFLRAHRYYIYCIHFYGNKIDIAIRSCESSIYTPNIYFSNYKEFECQTTSYGALNKTEYKNFYLAVYNAYYSLKALNQFDWDSVTENDYYYED